MAKLQINTKVGGQPIAALPSNETSTDFVNRFKKGPVQATATAAPTLLYELTNPNINALNTASDQFAANAEANDRWLMVPALNENTGGNLTGAVYIYDIESGALVKTYVGGDYSTSNSGIINAHLHGDFLFLAHNGEQTASNDELQDFDISTNSNGYVDMYDLTTGELIEHFVCPDSSTDFGSDLIVQGNIVYISSISQSKIYIYLINRVGKEDGWGSSYLGEYTHTATNSDFIVAGTLTAISTTKIAYLSRKLTSPYAAYLNSFSPSSWVTFTAGGITPYNKVSLFDDFTIGGGGENFVQSLPYFSLKALHYTGENSLVQDGYYLISDHTHDNVMLTYLNSNATTGTVYTNNFAAPPGYPTGAFGKSMSTTHLPMQTYEVNIYNHHTLVAIASSHYTTGAVHLWLKPGINSNEDQVFKYTFTHPSYPYNFGRIVLATPTYLVVGTGGADSDDFNANGYRLLVYRHNIVANTTAGAYSVEHLNSEKLRGKFNRLFKGRSK